MNEDEDGEDEDAQVLKALMVKVEVAPGQKRMLLGTEVEGQ